MSQIKTLVVAAGVVALGMWITGCTQRTQEQPSITFGTARISLGMTKREVEQHLSESARRSGGTMASLQSFG